MREPGVGTGTREQGLAFIALSSGFYRTASSMHDVPADADQMACSDDQEPRRQAFILKWQNNATRKQVLCPVLHDGHFVRAETKTTTASTV